MSKRSLALSGRAAVAVALLGGFYVLAGLVVAGIFGLNVVLLQSTGRVSTQLVIFSLVTAAAVLRGVFLLERRNTGPAEGIEVHRADEPELWSLVDDVSIEMGTRPPDELRIVHEVNAYVSETGGLLGLRRGRRLMAVGLGLVQVLTVDQLRAVLAHELGHYAGGDTRLGALSYRGGASLERTVSSLGAETFLGRVFTAYAKLYFRVSSAVRRRQELTADVAAVRIGGRDAHVGALRTLSAADAAYGYLLNRYAMPLWQRGECPDDLYSGLRSLWAEPSRQRELDEVREAAQHQAAGVYDSHPSLADRIVNAELSPEGVGRGDTRSAREVFADPVALERRVTAELSSRATGELPGVEGLAWEDVAARVFEPALAERAGELLDTVAHVDGGSAPATLGRLLDVIESEAVLRLAVMFAGDVRAVPEEQRADYQADVLRSAVVTTVACALVDQDLARWQLSWARDVELVDKDGSPLDVERWVAPAIDEPDLVAEMRRRLEKEGTQLSWAPTAPVARVQASPRSGDLLVGLLPGVVNERKATDALVLDRELVIVRSRRSFGERMSTGLAAGAGAYGAQARLSGATRERLSGLLQQTVDEILADDPANRAVPWDAVREARLHRRPGGWLLRLHLTGDEVVRLRSGAIPTARRAVADMLRPLLGDRLRA